MFAHCHPHAAQADQLGAVHSQRVNRRPANRGQSHDFRCVIIPRKVLRPNVAMSLKQGDLRSGIGIKRDQTIALAPITGGTGKT
jgi:hypothetical protein